MLIKNRYTNIEIAKLSNILDKPYSYQLDGADFNGLNLSSTSFNGLTLNNVNFNNAILTNATFKGSIIIHGSFKNAKLTDTDFSGAILSETDFSNADFRYSNLRGVNLRDAILKNVNFLGSNLTGSDLIGADLTNVNVRNVDFTGANLHAAALHGIKYNRYTNFFQCCPEEGSFIGWKKCCNDVIVKLLITEDAKRSSATSRKCRASKVKVLDVISADFGVSLYKSDVIYRVGDVIEIYNFDEDRFKEDTNGIHFFITRKEAELYKKVHR